jgi:peptidoglycan/xylan/chitin deacetylase (PgdA/CDA1 family)
VLVPVGLFQWGPAAVAIPGITAAVTNRLTRKSSIHHVAITFDDGPHPDGTPAVLALLDKFNVRATFFLIGEQVQRYPGIARRIADDGHEVALHGWDHQLLLRRSPIALTRSLTRARDTISSATGRQPVWYRPPYGVATGPALMTVHRLGMRPIWWTRWGSDWSTRRTPESISAQVLEGRAGASRMSNRDIVLLHDSDTYADRDSWRGTVAALPRILAGIDSLGLRVGPLTPCPPTPGPVGPSSVASQQTAR